MTPLPLKLAIGGFEMEQIKRSGTAAIYAQKRKGTVVAYEVIEIQQIKAEHAFGKDYPKREGYPNNSQWGRCAWTCVDLERAMERYRGMEREVAL